MKLGVTYNVFDGIELLESSILSIIDNVDYINIVYQTTSNFGEYLDNLPILNDLVDKKLVNHLIFYEPNLGISAQENEVRKRNIGLEHLKENGCTHFMNLDVDEFYKKNKLEWAKKEIDRYKYNATIVRMYRYYKYPTVQINNFLNGYVDYAPLIYSINNKLGSFGWRYFVDATRQGSGGNVHVFGENEIMMHHMAYIRTNMRMKMNNKYTRQNFVGQLEEMIKNFENYQLGDDVIINFQGRNHVMTVNVVDNIFNIPEIK